MQLVLKSEDIEKILKRTFNGVEKVEFSSTNKDPKGDTVDITITLTISEDGVQKALKAKPTVPSSNPDAKPGKVIINTPRVNTMGEGRGEGKRSMGGAF